MSAADNFLKTPPGPALGRIARQQVGVAFAKSGQSLPCSVVAVRGQIVTVKFELQSGSNPLPPKVTCPIAGAEYLRMPTQIGDKGLVISADAYLGGMSGLGGGVASLTPRANLSSLVFVPIGNTGFSTVDPNAVTIYGPNGVVLRDTASGTVCTLTPSGVVIKIGGATFTFSSTGLVVTGGDVKADAIDLKTHLHTGVTTGSGTTGGPIA